MEQNKYYTPDIQEFKVGFECEFFNNMQDKQWNKVICDQDHISIAYDSFEHGTEEWEDDITRTFRVKYLDDKDIEECGFKYIESTENGVNFIKHIDNPKQSIHLTLFNTNHRVGIAVYNFNVEPPMVYKEVGTFGGTIKNKSELKQMFKVLGVVE